MAKKKEFKTLETRAKDIVKKIDFEKKDQFNWTMKKWLDDKKSLEALKVLAHFISIPSHILNETETKMFDEEMFEKINVTNKE